MDNIRELSYKINGLATVAKDVLTAFESDFSGVKGVIGINIDSQNETVKYALDQWASDYDVFCKLNEICEKYNLDLDFGDNIEEVTVETEKEDIIETENGEVEDIETEETVKQGKLTKGDIIEKISVFGLSIIVTVVGLFLTKFPNVQPWILMIGFTLASYETLYNVIVKLAEKSYVFEDVVTFIGALVLMYLGFTTSAFVIMLLYGVIGFIQSYCEHTAIMYEEKLENQLKSDILEEEKNHIQEKLEFINYNKEICDLKTAKFSINRTKYNIAFIVFSLLLTFIPPLFKIKSYGIELTSKWLYVGASSLVISCFGCALYSLKLTAKTSVYKCLKEGVAVNEFNTYLNLSNLSSVCLDDSVINAEDVQGAVMEMKEDIGLSVNVVSSIGSKEVTEIKNSLGANGGLASASVTSKQNYAEKHNAILVGNEEVTLSAKNAIVYGKNGNICVEGNELKKVPFVIKMAVRTAKVLKMNKVLPFVVKAILIALIVVTKVFLSFDAIWWIVIGDFILNVCLLINALRNGSDPV